jgi:hypothetical protein
MRTAMFPTFYKRCRGRFRRDGSVVNCNDDSDSNSDSDSVDLLSTADLYAARTSSSFGLAMWCYMGAIEWGRWVSNIGYRTSDGLDVQCTYAKRRWCASAWSELKS